jgi:hypothetical protein
MKSLVAFYRQNIYGIMGTLVFHILLVTFLWIARINEKDEMRKDAIEIEIPIELLNTAKEPIPAETDANTWNQENLRNGEAPPGAATNAPSNRIFGSAKDKFFDEAYDEEVKSAKKLVEEVNTQLSRKTADVNSIVMPEDITEGKKEEDIKHKIYSGESNIEYHLGNRYHLRLPIPVYLARGGGVVTVDVEVNREGNVVSARARTTPMLRDENIFLYSEVAAQRTVFNSDPNAPVIQKGTIRYTFIPQ